MTTADPSLLTLTSVAVGFTPLIASVTFEISSAVNADASATVVKLGASTESDSFVVAATGAAEGSVAFSSTLASSLAGVAGAGAGFALSSVGV